MNKYILRLNGGIALARWECRYQDIDFKGLEWFVRQQFRFFPDIDEIQVFDDDDSQAYIGSFRKNLKVEWRQA